MSESLLLHCSFPSAMTIYHLFLQVSHISDNDPNRRLARDGKISDIVQYLMIKFSYVNK